MKYLTKILVGKYLILVEVYIILCLLTISLFEESCFFLSDLADSLLSLPRFRALVNSLKLSYIPLFLSDPSLMFFELGCLSCL